MKFAFSPRRTLQTRIAPRRCSPETPFLATLASSAQLTQNIATSVPLSANLDAASCISPLFATLTSSVTPKSFVCDSYKKHREWGYISCPLFLTASPTIPFGMRTSAKRTRNSFGIHSFKKTPKGVPPALSLPLFAPSAIINGLASPPGSATLCPVRTFRTHDAA